MANNYGVKHPKPFSFSTPNFSVQGFSGKTTSTGGFKFQPLFGTGGGKKSKAWQDIEAATGKQFSSYEQAINYLVDQSQHKSSGKGVGGFLSNLFGDTVDTIKALPTGLYEGNKALVKDILWDLPHGDVNFSNTRKIGSAIGKNYAHTYGPLVHGDVGGFWNNVYNNPLGPILDIASLVTLGAGGVVKAGSLTAKVGEAANMTRVARIGKNISKAGEAEPLYARSPEAIKAGEKAGEINSNKYRFTAGNPVIKARQKFIFKATQKSYGGIGEKLGLGAKLEERRFASRQVRGMTHEANVRLLKAAEGENTPVALDYSKAISKLNEHERAAANIIGLVGTHMPLDKMVTNAMRIAKEIGHEPPRDMVKLWTHPKTREAMTKAISDFRAGKENDILAVRNFADKFGTVDAAIKGVTPENASLRRWSTLAHLEATPTINRYIDQIIMRKNPELLTKKFAEHYNAVHDDILARLYVVAKQNGQSMEHTIMQAAFNGTAKSLWDEVYQPVLKGGKLKKKTAGMNTAAIPEAPDLPGELSPIYIPHKTGLDSSFGGTYRAQGGGEFIKRNSGVVLAMGRIAVGEDLLGPEFARTLRIAAAQDARKALIEASVKVKPEDVSAMIANGYQVIAKKGWDGGFMNTSHQAQLNELADLNEKTAMQKLRGMFTSSDNPVAMNAEKAAERVDGQFLMIRSKLADQILQEYHASSKVIKTFVETPMKLWKYVVLGLSPRNIVTNVVGNTLMAAVLAKGPLGAMKIVAHSALKTMTPEKVAEVISLKGQMGISNRFMQKFFPEHWQATFSHGELSLGKRSAKYAFAYNATHRNEVALRQGLFMELIRHDPTIEKYYKARVGGNEFTRNRWEAAAGQAFDENPALRAELSDRVDDALGNYRDFTNAERKIRQVMPFYSWYRHAARTGKALTQRPTTLAVGYRLGEMGQQENNQVFGNVPEFMKAFTPLGTNSDGTVQAVNTAGINPFHALAEMGMAANALIVHGDAPGAAGQISSFMNPGITAGIEGLTKTSLLTGAPSPTPNIPGMPGGYLPGVLSRILTTTPQARLGEAAMNETEGPLKGLESLTPTGRAKKPHQNTLSKGFRTQAYNFLGFPTKDVNVKAAQEWQAKIDQKGEFHMPKPRKKKPKKYGLPEFKWTK